MFEGIAKASGEILAKALLEREKRVLEAVLGKNQTLDEVLDERFENFLASR